MPFKLTRGDKVVLIATLLVAFLCFGLPRIQLHLDPAGDNVNRWYYEVEGGFRSRFKVLDGSHWRTAQGAPLVDAAGGNLLYQRLKSVPAPHAMRELGAKDPGLPEDLARLLRQDNVVALHQAAYLADPELPRDRWGRRWAMYMVAVRLKDGTWGWEGAEARVVSKGLDGKLDWGRGDDIVVSGPEVREIPLSSNPNLFLLLALPMLLFHGFYRAAELTDGSVVAREAFLSAAYSLPVWGLLFVVMLAFPRMGRLPFLSPLKALPMWVSPAASFMLTCGGVVWAVIFFIRVRRAAEIASAECEFGAPPLDDPPPSDEA